jgi:hypothetical protein
MQRIDVSRVRTGACGTRTVGWSGTFGVGLLIGTAIGVCLGMGPFRALAARAGERARDVGGELAETARSLADRSPYGQSFVDLTTLPEPATAGRGGEPAGRGKEAAGQRG